MNRKQNHLSERANWQRKANVTGTKGEVEFAQAIAAHLPGKYEVVLKPPKIPIYKDKKGIAPDIQIKNRETGQCIFIEKKTGHNGGNATHERAATYLSSGYKNKVKELHNTPENPFFIVFSGDTFTGRHGKLESYIVETVNKKGEVRRTTVNPKQNQEKVSVIFDGAPHAIMEHNFKNIKKVAMQIMEIV